jgi:PDZ domain-containing protein
MQDPDVTTIDPMLPPGVPADEIGEGGELPPTPTSRRRRVWSTIAISLVVLLILGVVGASFYPLPYYAIAPGSASDVSGLITVPPAKRHAPNGAVLLVTVTESKLVVLEFLRDQFDPNVAIYGRAAIEGPKPTQPLNQINLAEMTASKQTAIVVALRRLGYHVVEQGKGAAILQVVASSPAALAGLKVGDTVTAVGTTPVATQIALVDTIRAHQPGETVTLTLMGPDGVVRTTRATLAAQAGHAFLGVASATNSPQFTFPFPVQIDSRQIGGPSAGLAFTLSIINLLTNGQLTGGHKIATTGTIEADGSVGPVGGVIQKTVAVRRAGAEAFLVPPDEYPDALAHAGSKLKVIKVATLEDALNALHSLGGSLSGVPEPAPPLDR